MLPPFLNSAAFTSVLIRNYYFQRSNTDVTDGDTRCSPLLAIPQLTLTAIAIIELKFPSTAKHFRWLCDLHHFPVGHATLAVANYTGFCKIADPFDARKSRSAFSALFFGFFIVSPRTTCTSKNK
mmetsp:Transcript_35018/g.110647  ORF Transcript_35018/g.110647 Transcript_35018/m.110647 type:complete len:125 (+) Transcript_35018:166-540(+)